VWRDIFELFVKATFIWIISRKVFLEIEFWILIFMLSCLDAAIRCGSGIVENEYAAKWRKGLVNLHAGNI